MEIFKEFKFEAAHQLYNLPPGHKCMNLHGHSYRVRVYVRGRIDPQTGWVVDFGTIKQVCQPLIDKLDHSYLNDIPGLEQSTSEVLAIYLWRAFKPKLAGMSKIEVWETATSAAIYAGEDETP